MIHVLLLGLGRISFLLEKDELRYHPCTHAGTLLSKFGKKHFKVTGIYDPNADRVGEFIRFFSVNRSKIDTNLESISRKKFDLCVIASSSEAHFENAKFAIRIGIKNLLIEKPICMSSTDLQELYELKQKYSVNIWVNHERRYHPLYSYIRNAIHQKKYGDLVTIKASVLTSGSQPGNAFRSEKGKMAGPLLHDGTHAIDYIQWILGEPETYYSRTYKASPDSTIENQAVAMLRYPNNVTVFLEAGGYRKYFQFEIDLQTTEARFILSNDGHRFYVSKESKLYTGFRSLQKEPIPQFKKKYRNPWINLYREIKNVISHRSTDITSSIEDNIQILRTIESLYNHLD